MYLVIRMWIIDQQKAPCLFSEWFICYIYCWFCNNPLTSSSYLGNGLMAARLATLGALGAEGTVLYIKKRFSVAISCGSVLFMLSVSLKDTETQQWVSSPSALSGVFIFLPPNTEEEVTKDRCFLWDVLQVFLSNEQLKWDPVMNHQRASV